MPEERRRRLFAAEKALLEKRGVPVGSAGETGLVHTVDEILTAVLELKGLFESGHSGPFSNTALIQNELRDMRDAIHRTKMEIAAIRDPHTGTDEDRLTSAAIELHAVVAATETATHGILEAAEHLDNGMNELRNLLADPVQRGMVDDLASAITAIFEHCNFQDITGQRITKVVQTLQYLERRIETMIAIWGLDQFKGVDPVRDADDHKRDSLLHGPQVEGGGVDQNAIDKLFGG